MKKELGSRWLFIYDYNTCCDVKCIIEYIGNDDSKIIQIMYSSSNKEYDYIGKILKLGSHYKEGAPINPKYQIIPLRNQDKP
jgi:hypothetical protein